MQGFKNWMSASLLGLGLIATHGANAAVTTYQVSMDCTDCAEAAGTSSYPVWATLTLEDYTPGTLLSEQQNTFVSFAYSGSNLVAPFSLTRDGIDGNPNTVDYRSYLEDGTANYHLAGNLSNPNGANHFFIAFEFASAHLSPFNGFHFLSYPTGIWSMCAPNATGFPGVGGCSVPMDYGTDALYSIAAVPEPEQALMLGAGLLLMAGAARRAQRPR